MCTKMAASAPVYSLEGERLRELERCDTFMEFFGPKVIQVHYRVLPYKEAHQAVMVLYGVVCPHGVVVLSFL